MRSRESVARHDVGDRYGAVNLDRVGRGVYELVFGGPCGLETSVRFDSVEADSNTLTFHYKGRQVGDIERDDLGTVTDVLDALAATGEVREVPA